MIHSLIVLVSVMLVLMCGTSVGARSDLLTGPAIEVFQPLWQRWWFITVIGILASWAIITFERYRAARMKELNAALFESEELTQQLTVQQIELGKANRVLALDYAVTHSLVEAATPVEAALGILQTVCVTTGWDVGAIWDVDPHANAARCVGVWQKAKADAIEFEALSEGHIFLPDTGLPGRVLAGRRPHWVTDIAVSGSLPRMIAPAKESLRSGFGFPILVGSEAIGILELYSYEVRRPGRGFNSSWLPLRAPVILNINNSGQLIE